MDNIVNLGSERPRPRRRAGMPGGGARILFFTGVRYCRESDDNALSGSRGVAKQSAAAPLRPAQGWRSTLQLIEARSCSDSA